MTLDTPTLQLIAYSSLTYASIIVAATLLLLSYRQNFGWQPLIVVTSFGGGNESIHLEYEVWNRRKYPVTVIMQELIFSSLHFDGREVGYPDDSGWSMQEQQGQEQSFFGEEHTVIEPNKHQRFSLMRLT